jgi:hypothetical protein
MPRGGARPGSGRKPTPPEKRRVQTRIFLAPEEAVFLHEKYGSPVHGIRALLRQAMAAADSPPAEEPLAKIGHPRTAQALKPKVPRVKAPSADDLCERCRRIGTPSCDPCRKKTGQP